MAGTGGTTDNAVPKENEWFWVSRPDGFEEGSGEQRGVHGLYKASERTNETGEPVSSVDRASWYGIGELRLGGCFCLASIDPPDSESPAI